MAEEQKNPAGIAQSELGIAKVFGHTGEEVDSKRQGFAQAKSMREIGKRLLQSVGLASPDDASVQLAIEANDQFVQALEHIRDTAQRQLEADILPPCIDTARLFQGLLFLPMSQPTRREKPRGLALG
jgi:hypothetical protein